MRLKPLLPHILVLLLTLFQTVRGQVQINVTPQASERLLRQVEAQIQIGLSADATKVLNRILSEHPESREAATVRALQVSIRGKKAGVEPLSEQEVMTLVRKMKDSKFTALRELAEATPSVEAVRIPEPRPAIIPSGQENPAQQRTSSQEKHWITSSTSKRHNASCQYFGNSDGRPASSGEGIACKICGG